MARVMYFDCFSGAAGDMILGALLDAGLPLARLDEALGSLGVGHELRVTRVLRTGITANHVEVLERPGAAVDRPRAGHGHAHQHEHGHPHEHTHHHDHAHDHGPHDGHAHDHGHDHAHDHAQHHHPTGEEGEGHRHSHGADGHRSLAEIRHLIGHSALSEAGKALAIRLFQRLGEAEAAIHRMPIEEVHLHEVGALDSIIDIVGAVFAMEWFGIDEVMASPLNVGGGMVQIAHGRFPVPAPATARLLTGIPIYSAGPQVELLTPTGALLMSHYASSFGPIPAMSIERIGYGAGTRDFPNVPNVLRVLIGERTPVAPFTGPETVVKIECDIDDMNPQWFGPVQERLLAAGALDVWVTPVQMKKGRPGVLLTVLSPEDRRAPVCDVLFRDTTTLGVRYERVWRETLERHWEDVPVTGGVVRIKVASRKGETLNAMPEFEDCLRIAQSTGRPVKAVHAEAMQAWGRAVR